MKPSILCLLAALGFLSLGVSRSETAERADEPVALSRGVHLLLDDHLIARSAGIERKVTPPQRSLEGPIVTGAAEHQNWQPFLTVLHDASAPAAKRFRMWYNADVVDDPADGAYYGVTGYLESADGIRWPGPYRRLKSLVDDGRARFGASVLDEGPQHPTAAERYKMMYFDAGKRVGPRVAFSADGLQWAVHDGGAPILRVQGGDDIWSAGFDPLRKRYFLIGKTYGPHTWTNAEGKKVTANIRRYVSSVSQDFKTWSEPKLVFVPDDKDSGITQWYGAAGFQVRGNLIVGFLRVLRDDTSPTGVPREAVEANTRGGAGLGAAGADGGSGTGYTVLTWTHDGETWHRDRHTDQFLTPDPKPGAWDHAMAWVGSALPVGDDLYLYYAGYRWGHKYRHSVDRQLGLVKMKRDRFVARQAGDRPGTLTTRPFTLQADALKLNADSRGGEIRVQITDAVGTPLPGFRFEDCRPLAADALDAPVDWGRPLSTLRGRTIRLEFHIRNARLYALEMS